MLNCSELSALGALSAGKSLMLTHPHATCVLGNLIAWPPAVAQRFEFIRKRKSAYTVVFLCKTAAFFQPYNLKSVLL